MTDTTHDNSERGQPAGLGCNEGLGQVPTRVALDELAAQALAQMDNARDFPANTCSASRHLAEIAEAILRGQPCPQLTEDPQHCAESMAWTVASLWYARTEIDRLRDLLARVADRDASACSEWLGPLPAPNRAGRGWQEYTAAEMRAYAAQERAAERERLMQLVRDCPNLIGPHAKRELLIAMMSGPNARGKPRRQASA